MNNRNWYEPYITSWGTEAPSQFSEALARTIPIQAGKTRLLDIGCGSGIIGIYCLIEKNSQSVTFTDIAPIWIDIARSNVDLKVHEGLIDPSRTKFLEPTELASIPYDEVAQHDLVSFNPPQLPYAYVDEATRQKIDSDPIERSFRRGGESGLEIVSMFFTWYASLPMPKPDAVILLSSFLGRRNIENAMSISGLTPREAPIESNATLRSMFWEYAERFSNSPSEMADRSIRKVNGVWHKKLLTYRLTNQR